MTVLPESIIKAFEDREGPIVFATVASDGKPNIIYATCVSMYENRNIVIADNYFDKTKHNIIGKSKVSILFMTKAQQALQLKGTVEYVTHGAIFDWMKTWNPSKHPGHGAAVVTIEQAYSGSSVLL